ncbi:hypothetical protein KRP22_004701 [Phytophthora ramorum]|nr:putative ZDHHC-type palmitoyltransferase 4 [Phytophthora ramorum]
MRHLAVVGPLFVAVGYGLIVGIAFVHFTKFLPTNSPVHWISSIFLASELLLQYSLAIWSDPGFVEPEHLVHCRDLRICRLCEAVKPHRAHHCRECRRCVYEMDHHCPWINNCVGYYNYRHFWLLLMYIWVSCLYVAALSAGLFVATFTTSSEDDEAAGRDHVVLDRFKVLFSFMATSVVGVVVCGYWGWHVYLVLTEQSTIEFMQREGGWIRPSVSVASTDVKAPTKFKEVLNEAGAKLHRDERFANLSSCLEVAIEALYRKCSVSVVVTRNVSESVATKTKENFGVKEEMEGLPVENAV